VEERDYEVRPEGEGSVLNWKITLGGSFMVMAIFWAGAMYNRMGNMESAIADIKQSLAPLGEVAILKVKLQTLTEQVDEFRRQHERDPQQH
jgi:hypothetical protein